MSVTKKSHTCLVLAIMASLALLMILMYAISGSQTVRSENHKQDYQVLGKPPYKLALNWPRKPELFTGNVFAVAVNPHAGLVYVAQRGDHVAKVLVFTTDGDFHMSWNTTTLEMPHGMFVADAAFSNYTVWITDVGKGPYGHTIKQYSPAGNLLKILGTQSHAGSGLNPLQFDQPAEVFVHDSGEMYIVDGDGGMNNRIIKLSKDHHMLWIHGEKGQSVGQFNIPHSVTVDNAKRVWVADRGNKRIQVLNSVTGEWLGTWESCFSEDAPFSVRLTPDNRYFVVVQLNTNRILLLDSPPVGLINECRVVNVIQLADDVRPHLVDLDQKSGDLYVAEIGAKLAQKFVPLESG